MDCIIGPGNESTCRNENLLSLFARIMFDDALFIPIIHSRRVDWVNHGKLDLNLVIVHRVVPYYLVLRNGRIVVKTWRKFD